MKKCPFCGEEIQDVAIKCRYCGEWLEDTEGNNEVKKDKKIDNNIDKNKEGKDNNSIPGERKKLSKEQKELLKNRFPISGGYRILAFLFPSIYLLYSRSYYTFVLVYLFIGFVSNINVLFGLFFYFLLRLYFALFLPELCYGYSAIKMKRCLLNDKDIVIKDLKKEIKYPIMMHIAFGLGFASILIVVLSWRLFPKLNGVGENSRDLQRQKDIAVISDALTEYYDKKGALPGADGSISIDKMVPLSVYSDELLENTSLTYIPMDPNSNNWFYGLRDQIITGGEYGYLPYNDEDGVGFFLMAGSESFKYSNAVSSEYGLKFDCDSFVKGDIIENVNGKCSYVNITDLVYSYINTVDLKSTD